MALILTITIPPNIFGFGHFGPPNIGSFRSPKITFETSNFFATSVTVGDQLWVCCGADGSEPMTVKWVIVGSTFS